MAGGNFEFHYNAKIVNYKQLDSFWDDLARARRFMETLPFQDMSPQNSLVDRGLALVKSNEAYVVYLPSGGTVNDVNCDGRVTPADFIEILRILTGTSRSQPCGN